MTLNTRQWEPAFILSSEGNRSPDLLNRLLDQFHVETEERYRSYVDPKTGKLVTWCNIYTWDVTSAAGCEVPHWVPNPEHATDPSKPARRELNAYALEDWFKTDGIANGWRAVDELAAQANAEAGRISVAIGGGHINVLRPKRNGDPAGTYCAQAGKTNFAYGRLTSGFGQIKPTFWVHA